MSDESTPAFKTIEGEVLRVLEERMLLTKRDQFAAYALMGLTSRLQPIQTSTLKNKRALVELAFEMADLAVEQSEK